MRMQQNMNKLNRQMVTNKFIFAFLISIRIAKKNYIAKSRLVSDSTRRHRVNCGCILLIYMSIYTHFCYIFLQGFSAHIRLLVGNYCTVLMSTYMFVVRELNLYCTLLFNCVIVIEFIICYDSFRISIVLYIIVW